MMNSKTSLVVLLIVVVQAHDLDLHSHDFSSSPTFTLYFPQSLGIALFVEIAKHMCSSDCANYIKLDVQHFKSCYITCMMSHGLSLEDINCYMDCATAKATPPSISGPHGRT